VVSCSSERKHSCIRHHPLPRFIERAQAIALEMACSELDLCAKPATPVNRFPNPDSCVNLIAPNWERLKIEVRERIDALAATMSDRCNAPPELKAKLYADLILPNVRLLAEFCLNVQLEEAS
jgi:hypothetical protein